jgi:hypothetical protein
MMYKNNTENQFINLLNFKTDKKIKFISFALLLSVFRLYLRLHVTTNYALIFKIIYIQWLNHIALYYKGDRKSFDISRIRF